MQLQLSHAQQRFVFEVRSFLDAHWRPGWPDQHRPQHLDQNRSYFEALAKHGWSVPHWPERWGGTGWSVEQRYLLARELAAARAPELGRLGVDLLGPLLMAVGTDAQCSKFLPPIRDGRERWCVHGTVFGTRPLEAVYRSTGVRLRRPGQPLSVRHARHADWLLMRVQLDGRSRVAVAPLKAIPIVPGLPLDPDRFDGADLALELIGGACAEPDGMIDKLVETVLGPPVCASVRLQGQLAEVVRLLEKTSGVAESGLQSRVEDLQVSLAAIDALEQRLLIGPPAEQADTTQSARWLVVRVRSRELAQQVARLAVDALGYHALPAADPLALDNEGPLGPTLGQDAIDDLFGYVGELGLMADRDRIAALNF